MKNTGSQVTTCLLGVLLMLGQHAPCAHAAGSSKRRMAKPRRELIAESGPSEDQIWDSGLLEKELTAATLYERGQQWFSNVDVKRFPGPVLGYVTPWHRKGYDNAVRFRAKLTHIAPVWYQLKRQDKAWVLEGGHEYNRTWIDEVREPAGEVGSMAKVVPRFIVELTSGQDHIDLVSQPGEAVQLLVNEVVAKDYDGLVLEVWMTWVHMNAMNNEGFVAAALGFVATLHQSLHAAQGRPRQLVLAVPPPVPQGYSRPAIAEDQLRKFSPHVDFWSLMTYDYALGSGPQPNSPVPWLEMQRKLMFESEDGPTLTAASQALLGINFYGYDYHIRDKGHPEAVIAEGALALLARHQPTLEWSEEAQEHYWEYQAKDGRHRMYFPTPRSMEVRLEMFRRWGVGCSIWELGQGLERFFDLL